MLDISSETEARLHDEAKRQGISVDALLGRLIPVGGWSAHIAGVDEQPKLPRLNLGVKSALHRRDIYDDAC